MNKNFIKANYTNHECKEDIINACNSMLNTIEEYFNLNENSEKYISSFSLWRPNLSGVKRKKCIDIDSMKEILESLTKIQDVLAKNKNTPKQHKDLLECKDYIPLIKGAIYVLKVTKEFGKHEFKNLSNEELKNVKELFEIILKNIKEPTVSYDEEEYILK